MTQGQIFVGANAHKDHWNRNKYNNKSKCKIWEKNLEKPQNLFDEYFGVCYQINEIFFWKFSYADL